MKKYFLSSMLVMDLMAPAFGADGTITGGAGTCTVDVLGVSDNNATANTIATWSLNEYTLNPGEYLKVTDTSVTETTCPAGSYCVGGGFTVETANSSIAQCPTGYPNSDAGAGADSQCYTVCTVANANIAHATAVKGNDYYGTGTDTCEPTECMAGWHIKPGLDIGATIGEDAGTDSAYINNNGSFSEKNWDGTGPKGQEYYGISDKNSFAVDYAGKGLLTGRASCQPKADPAVEYFWNNVYSFNDGDISREEFYAGLVSAGGTTKADILMDYYDASWGDGIDDEESMYKKYYTTFIEPDANYSTDSTGQYCYCQVDGFTPTGGTKAIVTSAPWVFSDDGGSADDCADRCAHNCSFHVRSSDVVRDLAFRAVAVGNIPALPATCEANTINIDWNPDNGGEHIKNMCTYEGEITLPTPDPVKPGYTFTGWKLVE